MSHRAPCEAEVWAIEAKRQYARGNHEKAFELLRQSAEALPGRPRVELDTAELARRLGHAGLAVYHYRRASIAYAKSGFARHALPPLRTALNFEHSRLPDSAESFALIARDLAEALVGQGFTGDAHQVLQQAAEALASRGLPVPDSLIDRPRARSERVRVLGEDEPTAIVRPARRG
jgi:tetratricopeptide (TPR) repeat protein